MKTMCVWPSAANSSVVARNGSIHVHCRSDKPHHEVWVSCGRWHRWLGERGPSVTGRSDAYHRGRLRWHHTASEHLASDCFRRRRRCSGRLRWFLARPRTRFSPLIRYGSHVGLNEGRIKVGQYLFHLHGGKIVLFGRFFPALRIWAAVLAGVNQMAWPKFVLFNAADSCSEGRP